MRMGISYLPSDIIRKGVIAAAWDVCIVLTTMQMFLSRAGRESDYLWGRLDGAERLIGILLEDASDADKERWCNEAFRAILAEDAAAVPKAADLVQHVRKTIDS